MAVLLFCCSAVLAPLSVTVLSILVCRASSSRNHRTQGGCSGGFLETLPVFLLQNHSCDLGRFFSSELMVLLPQPGYRPGTIQVLRALLIKQSSHSHSALHNSACVFLVRPQRVLCCCVVVVLLCCCVVLSQCSSVAVLMLDHQQSQHLQG